MTPKVFVSNKARISVTGVDSNTNDKPCPALLTKQSRRPDLATGLASPSRLHSPYDAVPWSFGNSSNFERKTACLIS
jgi:hypothetical protein